MSSPRKPAPRRHCPQCAPPADPGIQPAELTGKSCTATFGTTGPGCDRKAVTVDKHNRPICNVETWDNVRAHQGGAHSTMSHVPGPPAAVDDPSQLAPVAQDLPGHTVHVAGVTLDQVREVVREELDNFATEVLRIPATMGQSQVALHPVGLCDDGRCQPCKAQRSGEHSQAKKLLAGDIDAAIEHVGRGAVAEQILRDGSDALAEVLDRWRDAGRPQPSSEPAAQVKVVQS